MAGISGFFRALGLLWQFGDRLAPLLETLRIRGYFLSDALVEAALARVGEGGSRR